VIYKRTRARARAHALIRNVRVALVVSVEGNLERRSYITNHLFFPLFSLSFFFFLSFFLSLSLSFFFCLFVVVVVSDMRSSSQKIIVRYFLQIILACAPYRESSAREIIIRHFLQCMHIAFACMPKSLSPSLPLSLSLSLSVFFFSLSPSVGVYRRGSSGSIMRTGSRLLIPRYTGRRMIL